MTAKNPNEVAVSVTTEFLDEHSRPHENHYVFAYTITLHNRGQLAARLLSRHWVLTDGNGEVREVRGEGVIGEQPLLQPGERFQYTSGATFETCVGTMQGTYQMVSGDGTGFEAQIPEFVLSIPRTLH